MVGRRRLGACVVAASAACFGSFQQRAVFVPPASLQIDVEVPVFLRGSSRHIVSDLGFSPGAARRSSAEVLPSIAVFTFAVVALAGRTFASSVACRAGETVQNGVRVVEGKEIPWEVYTPDSPLMCRVVENPKQPRTLTKLIPDPNWEINHITIDHGGKFKFVEGQNIYVLAPGRKKSSKAPPLVHVINLASSAVGDDEQSTTLSFCVKRVRVDRFGDVLSRRAYDISPSALCELRPGDAVEIAGPVGDDMLLPDDNSATLLMFGTGAQIAPLRSNLRLLFNDGVAMDADGMRKFKGLAWLFSGATFSSSLLYNSEFEEYAAKYPHLFRYESAVSRQDTNEVGEKMYVSEKMKAHSEEIWQLLQKPSTHVYLSGRKDLTDEFEEVFKPLVEASGQTWTAFLDAMIKARRYHIELV